jgi:hypothetical protein
MNTGISLGCLRIMAIMLGFVALCGFENSRNGPVLELPQSTATANSENPPNASIEYNDPGGSIPSGPDLRFHQFLKFYGCWSSTVTRKELTDFADTGSGILGHWANQRYTICFVRDLSGELQPNMSQTPSAGAEIRDLSSSTEVTGYDDQVVSLLNRYTFMYTEAAPAVHWYSLKRTVRQVEIQQVMNISCLRDGLHLICAARAIAKCKGGNCYSFSWKAKFAGSRSTSAHAVEAPE